MAEIETKPGTSRERFSRNGLRALVLLSLWPVGALAQGAKLRDDEPIPYPGDEQELEAPLPSRSEPSRAFLPVEETESDGSLAGFDDPNIGLGAELLGGLLLLDSSRGALVESRLAYGARVTWELGRMFSNEALREALFADATWAHTSLHDGTAEINATTSFDYLLLAPAYAIPFGRRSPIAFYGQAGVGMTYQQTLLRLPAEDTQLGGLKPTFQYGIGLRGRPAVTADGSVRFTFRLELTRFRRSYMDDTLIAVGVGALF